MKSHRRWCTISINNEGKENARVKKRERQREKGVCQRMKLIRKKNIVDLVQIGLVWFYLFLFLHFCVRCPRNVEKQTNKQTNKYIVYLRFV